MDTLQKGGKLPNQPQEEYDQEVANALEIIKILQESIFRTKKEQEQKEKLTNIAIILFGITDILGGKELSALLGGISGYILGRVSENRAVAKNLDKTPPECQIQSTR